MRPVVPEIRLTDRVYIYCMKYQCYICIGMCICICVCVLMYTNNYVLICMCEVLIIISING